MSRRLAREAAMCLLFEREINGEPGNETLEEMKDILHTDKIREKHGAYIDHILTYYEQNAVQVDAMIADCSVDWKLERLNKVDLSILRLAIIELFYLKEIPYRGAVNEAVELAKKFSSEKSPAFINGVLGAIIQQHVESTIAVE